MNYKVYWVDVLIPAPPLNLKRRFYFAIEEQRDEFRHEAKLADYEVAGFGTEIIIRSTNAVRFALRECQKEAESV